MATVLVAPDRGDSIRQLAKGIWYVDLNRAPMPAIDSVMDRLAIAKGVVFDLRGYPNGNHDVISHLLTDKEQRGEEWMWVPRITYPDRERIAGWNGFGWASLQPKEPHISGKVVFLTDGEAVSYAESFMGYIEGFKLAEIVGGPTAGTNGNINPIDLPGGYSFWWTGMKVTKFDGSQHHLIGIQPTVPLERTLKAVHEGRDEYIEKAVELIRGSAGVGKRS
jgi:C-terminal processing protease CtpA/Prc